MAWPISREEILLAGLLCPSSWDPLIQAGLRSAVLRCPRLSEVKAEGHIWRRAFLFDDDGSRRLPDPDDGMVWWECDLCPDCSTQLPAGMTTRAAKSSLSRRFGAECSVGGVPGSTVSRECSSTGHWRPSGPSEAVADNRPTPDSATSEGEAWRFIGDVWECRRCHATTRNPRIGQIGSMADCSWRGKGRLRGGPGNAVEDDLIELCDLHRKNGYGRAPQEQDPEPPRRATRRGPRAVPAPWSDAQVGGVPA
jgi:hypothetical protein